MARSYPRFKAAACHAASVFLDSGKTADKACDLIAEASRHGAKLVVFPESFMPGFPVWAALQAPILSHDFFATFASEAVRLDGPEIEKVRIAARRHGVIVSLGITEGTDASVGCLWNSNILIGPDGTILNHHRKLVPTFYEKLVWANGDGRGLRVVATELGRLGMLICGENTNPLARFTLMAQGEQVHISSYPPVWPTRPSAEAGGYNLRRAIEIRAGSHAFEAKVFNVVASACLDVSIRDELARLDKTALDTLENSPRAVSMILDPSGDVISDVMVDHEGIAYAEIDIARSIEPKQFHDVVGYYNRFDIFRLDVDRTPRNPAEFVDEQGVRTQVAQPATAGVEAPTSHANGGSLRSSSIRLSSE
jgi:nitrilase